MKLRRSSYRKVLLSFLTFLLLCWSCFADENSFQRARQLQQDGRYDEAVEAFKLFLMRPEPGMKFVGQEISLYAEALMQMMNTFQAKGEPEACITALQELFQASPVLQRECLRDYYSVLGYALSRTEKMQEAREVTRKVFTLPLHHPTPERYFRDYAYAAAVFYSSPAHQEEVIEWCEEALLQAQSCDKRSGKQWVTSMLGSLYKRSGRLNKALDLFQQSREEAMQQGDELGVLNSLHSQIDLFLYWDVPEYANFCANEAIRVEEGMTKKNPMVSAQTYISKGRAMLQLGVMDSVSFYVQKARNFCTSLPYNSGSVDVDLLHGMYLAQQGGDSLHLGIHELQQVVHRGTVLNRAKAYHQLAQIYLRNHMGYQAEIMLDSMSFLLNQSSTQLYIHVDYQPILEHFFNSGNHHQVELYTGMMLLEQKSLKEKRLNFNLVEAIVEQQTRQKQQELQILQLQRTNQRLWFLVVAAATFFILVLIVIFLFHQKRQHKIQMKQAADKLALLAEKLHQSNVEKDLMSKEINDIMRDKDRRQELETLTPSILLTQGESKFRQRFELLYPLFLPRLREQLPSITRREELLSMLIVLKQDNKEIAELLAIAPRSVLMLRHRFRQKLGMSTDHSLEYFIETILEPRQRSGEGDK